MSHRSGKKKFIRGVVEDCVLHMKPEDKAYIRENPYSIEYHFGYALYIRNHYIYDEGSKLDFAYEPDQLSSDIMTYIFSLLLPGEYIYGDRFIEWLFDDRKFIAMRKAYREKYGHSPMEIILKYRKIDSADADDSDESIENSFSLIDNLIRELAEKVWDTCSILQYADARNIDLGPVKESIDKIKEIFFTSGEYIPMSSVLLPYRKEIDEEKYKVIRDSLCTALEETPWLAKQFDYRYYRDREIAKAVLSYPDNMQYLPEYQADDDMVLYAMERDGTVIEYVDKKYSDSRDWVMFAIDHSDDGAILSLDCMMPYRTDKEIVYRACKVDKQNFAYVDEKFQDDYNLAKIVIADNRNPYDHVYSYLSERLKNDQSLALLDAATDMPNVEYYSDSLKDNKTVAKKLIEVHGADDRCLKYMSDRIKRIFGYKK